MAVLADGVPFHVEHGQVVLTHYQQVLVVQLADAYRVLHLRQHQYHGFVVVGTGHHQMAAAAHGIDDTVGTDKNVAEIVLAVSDKYGVHQLTICLLPVQHQSAVGA